ncbi:DUF3352 domain-containing protein [Okeania sp.]|uniref:DUF3352 domain-containing protein n=1 Tax=Okeania sp. TaxID=3100323 RepID=UPI002B4AB4FB|nr:DUF3352 domain-containing protein [Okeania sp.]MEB3343116.1 DUF3352 domain-containing protein [Okeania sp.]
MKKFNFLTASLVLIAAGGVATYFYLKNVAIKVSSPLNTAQVVPGTASMATFIQPNQKAITKLQQFGTPEARKLISESYAEFQAENLAENDIDWEKDIQPWLGGVMLAFVPGDERLDTQSLNLLMIVGIKNKFQALKFVTKLKGDDESKVRERKYQGVTIREVTDKDRKKFSIALLGDYLAIAPVAAAVEDAIDTFQGKNASMGENVVEVLQQSAGVENAIATVFIPNYAEFVREFADDLSAEKNLSAGGLQQLEQINSLVMGIGVDDQGVRLRAVTKLVAPLSPELTRVVSGEILQRFPVETMMLVSGTGISQLWSLVMSQAQGNQDLQNALDTVRNTFSEVGLDVDREVSWMDGEFAAGLITSSEGILRTTGVGGAMVLETSDRSAAEVTLKKLNEIAIKNPGVAVKERQVGSQLVTEWQMLGVGTFFGYGWLDDNALFLALGEPLIEGMMSVPENGLIGSAGFEEIVGSLPKSNQGYFYLDMEQAMVWAHRYPFVNVLMSSEVKTILGSIRGIGVTASWSDELTNEIEMLLAL